MSQDFTTLLFRAERVAALLKAGGGRLAVSESSAGGLIAAALLAMPGASAYFLGGAVVYTRPSREAFLGVGHDGMQGIRSASEPYAQLCARAARDRLGAEWGLAETGAAGPAGNAYGDAPGHACFAVAGPREAVVTLETGGADRLANMFAFAHGALELLERQLRA
jgi:PncC family amidohydrolase